jgi:hypothetical protein
MLPDDVERFEAAAGGLLTELGYPRAFTDPSRERLEQTANVRKTLAPELRFRDDVIPASR